MWRKREEKGEGREDTTPHCFGFNLKFVYEAHSHATWNPPCLDGLHYHMAADDWQHVSAQTTDDGKVLSQRIDLAPSYNRVSIVAIKFREYAAHDTKFNQLVLQ